MYCATDKESKLIPGEERYFCLYISKENGRRKITQNSIELDDETKKSTRKTEEKLDGRYKEGHERKKPN